MNDLDNRVAELKGYSGVEFRNPALYAHPLTNVVTQSTQCICAEPFFLEGMPIKKGMEFTLYPEEGRVIRIDPKLLKIHIGGLWSEDDGHALTLLAEIPGEIKITRLNPIGWSISLSIGETAWSMAGRTLALVVCRAYIAWKERQSDGH